MWFQGVIPDKIIDQVMVEWFDISDVLLIILQELGAKGAVKTFDIGIRLRVSGVSIEVDDRAGTDGIDEVFFELATIVGLAYRTPARLSNSLRELSKSPICM
jgi:hypothetical protein